MVFHVFHMQLKLGITNKKSKKMSKKCSFYLPSPDPIWYNYIITIQKGKKIPQEYPLNYGESIENTYNIPTTIRKRCV